MNQFTEKEQTAFNDIFSTDFLRGQRDCKEGVTHCDQGEAYNRGYATQYESEQVVTARSESWVH